MSEDQGGAGTRIFRAGARRLGSTGTLGRRALWADGQAGPTGRAGPGPTSRRASEAEEAEEASGGRPRLNLAF